jgi:hypothetical protein
MRGLNLIGQKFGKLTVLLRDVETPRKEKDYNFYWWCQCDCGNKITARSNRLNGGCVKSCGCLNNKCRSESFHWKGYEDISSSVFGRIKICAKRRKILFDITIQQIWELFLKQNKTCALTGLSLTFPSRNNEFDGTASLDRIDSSKGYVMGNIQWVHKDINFMKQQLSTEKLIEYSKLICAHNIK